MGSLAVWLALRLSDAEHWLRPGLPDSPPCISAEPWSCPLNSLASSPLLFSARRVHSYAAPLHRIKTDDMLPLRLLSPYQAENDHHIKDTYNYLTIQV